MHKQETESWLIKKEYAKTYLKNIFTGANRNKGIKLSFVLTFANTNIIFIFISLNVKKIYIYTFVKS